MLFSVAAILAATAALASAQNTTTPTGVDHQIVVGGAAGLVYTPNSITANIGDTVTFVFQTKNHTVTQSAFATPCDLLTNTTTNQVGFDSGFVPVSANATDFPAWTLEVTAATPIWFYCQQTGHCQQGMVGAINAPATGAKTFAAFQALAMGSNSTTGGTSANGAGVGATASTGAGASSVAATAAGSSASSSSSATGTSAPTSGAGSSARVGSAGVGLAIVAASLFLFA